MKLVCERDALDRIMGFVASRARNKLKVPILTHVKLDAANSSLIAVATDLDTRSEAACAAEIARAGATTVPAERLMRLVEGLAAGSQIEMELSGQELHVRCGRSRYKLPTMLAEDFPTMSEPAIPTVLTLGCLDIKTLFSDPQAAISITGTRVMMEGGYLHQPAPGELAVMGADGIRLIRRSIPTSTVFPLGCIVPKASMVEIIRLASEGEVTLRCGDNLIEAKCGHRSFTTKLIEATYPDVQRYIPSLESKTILVDRAEFMAAFKRLTGVADNLSQIDIDWNEGEASIQLSLTGEGSGIEHVACECDCASGRIAFMPNVLGQMLEPFKCDVLQLQFHGTAKAARIVDPSDPDFVVLAMPCQPRGNTQEAAQEPDAA